MYLSYSLIAMPLAILGLPLFIYLPTFYANFIDNNIAIVGAILFISRLTDVITDPFIGLLSDKSIKVFKSRKPVMILGFFILIVSFYYLINPIKEYALIYLLIFSIFVYLGWSLVTIPYLTWSSELSYNYHEKTKLNSYREIFTLLGLTIALILPTFTENNLQNKLNLLYLFFIIIFIPFFIFSMIKVKPKIKSFTKKISIKEIKEFYIKNSNFKNLQLGYFLNNLANAIPATIFLIFIETIINDKEAGEWILLVYFLSGLIALPLWVILSKIISKKEIWIYSILLSSISFIFVLFLKQGDVLAFAIISFISGLSLGADIAFPTSMQSDFVQKNENSSMSGLIFGIWTMLTKLSLAFAVVLSFSILGIFGFDQDNINENSKFAVLFTYGLLPVLIKLIAIFYIKKFKE